MLAPIRVPALLLLCAGCGGSVGAAADGASDGGSSWSYDSGSMPDGSWPASDADAGSDATGSSMADAGGSSQGLYGPMQELAFQDIGVPQSLALGDVNGDGRTDIVLGNLTTTNQHNLLVFLQTPSGGIASAPIVHAFGSSPLVVADVTGDGRDDIVAATPSGTSIAVAAQQKDGTLGAPVTYPIPPSGVQPVWADDIVTADFNADHALDVVVVSAGNVQPSPGGAYVFFQTATGTLETPPQKVTTLGGGRAHVGDLNGDGLPDLVTLVDHGPSSPTTIGVIPLASPGTFGSGYEANGSGAYLGQDFILGDVDGDGSDDVVTAISANKPDSKVLVSPQVHGTLTPPATYDSGDLPGPLRVADVDMDGRNDVVVAHPGWLNVGVYLQKSDGTLAPELTLPSAYGSAVLAVGDVDGDGKPDIVTADQQRLVIFHHVH